MSKENVEVVRRWLDASNRRDRHAFLALCDPNIEWLPPPDWPETATIRGREAAWGFSGALEEPWEPGGYELVEIIDGGIDKIAGRLRRRLRGRTSGLDAEFDYWGVATVRDGKLCRIEFCADRAEALETVRLRE